MVVKKIKNVGCDTTRETMRAIYWSLVKYSDSMTAERDMAPLRWYVGTARCSTQFLKALINAKPFMIARRLEGHGGDYDESIRIICNYLGCD